MLTRILWLSVAAACCGAALAAAPLSFHPVFGPETPTGRYKHPASITELTNGDLFLAWYGGDGEYEPGTAVWGSRFTRGKWSAPARLAHDEFYSVGNPVIWQAPDQVLWLWYVIRPGRTWSTSRIAAKLSRDEGRTWSDSTVVSFEEGAMVRGKPIVLAGGDYLLPVWKETGFDPEVVGADTEAFFLRYRPSERTWSASSRIGARMGALQPAVAELTPQHLIAFCRRGGGYGSDLRGYVVRSESNDGGVNWEKGVETGIPNPNAAVDLLKLSNGHLLLIFNNSFTDRTPLTVAISSDGGKSFPIAADIATGAHDFAYPYAIQTRDGLIHLVFTSEKRTVINHAAFTEQDLVERSKNATDRPVLHSLRSARDFPLTANPQAAQWRGIAPVLAEKDNYGKAAPLPPTEIRSRWTKRNLYLLFSCPYDVLHVKPGPDARHETPKLWEWDVAEAFIGSDPAHPERYREFEMSPQGEWLDLAIDLAHPASDHGASWNSGFRVKARIDAERKIWYGEMKIPQSAFEGEPSRLGLFRMQGKTEILWTPTGSPSFHVPGTFGVLRLDP